MRGLNKVNSLVVMMLLRGGLHLILFKDIFRMSRVAIVV